MNLYKEVIKALSKKTAADFDIDEVKRRIAATRARTPIPVADPPPAQRPVNPYSQFGKVVSSRNIPAAQSDNVRPVANRSVAQPAPQARPTQQRPVTTKRPVVPNIPISIPTASVARPATPTPQPTAPIPKSAVPVATPTAQNTKQAVPAQKPSTQPAQATPAAPQYQLTEDGIKYTQYQLNDPRLKGYRKRLKNMGFARFDENGPWLATPHGANTMRELQQGLDRTRIAEMLDEGQVPLGVFSGPSKPITSSNQSQLKTPSQPATQQPVQPTQVTTPAIKPTAQQQQIQPTVQPNTGIVERNAKVRLQAPSRAEALRQRQEKINNDIYKRYPWLKDKKNWDKTYAQWQKDYRRADMEYQQYKNEQWRKQLEELEQTSKNLPQYGADAVPERTLGEQLDDFYTYNVQMPAMNMSKDIGNLLYALGTPVRKMRQIASQSTRPWYY